MRKFGQRLIGVDDWEPNFGVALPKKTIKAAWELARRSKVDPIEREKAVAELLRAQGYYVIWNSRSPFPTQGGDVNNPGVDRGVVVAARR